MKKIFINEVHFNKLDGILESWQLFRATIKNASGDERVRIKTICPLGASEIREARKQIRRWQGRSLALSTNKKLMPKYTLEDPAKVSLETLSDLLARKEIGLDDYFAADFAGRVPEESDRG